MILECTFLIVAIYIAGKNIHCNVSPSLFLISAIIYNSLKRTTLIAEIWERCNISKKSDRERNTSNQTIMNEITDPAKVNNHL